jgi:two-component system sensor histidine kinase HydH
VPDKLKLALIGAGIAAVTAGHYVTPATMFLWHNIFQRLYYLPIIFGAILFGWAGGLLAAAVSAICYVPHIVMTWRDHPEYTTVQYAEIAVFFLVGGVTGVLADRERKRSEELRRVYQELQESFEQIKRADRLSAVGQLAAGLAHELRNPLGSIAGAADILEREPGSEERRREFLGIIRKESRRLDRLLTNLLDFARPRQPRIQAVSIHQIVNQVVALTSHTAQRQGIRIDVDAPPLAPLRGDPEQLQQVILNLTLNAIQAMPGGGRITLSARREGASFAIRVTDEGEGIPAENLDRIFDPFYTTKESGTGLGLAVAHQIVTQHGGRIEVARNPNRGVTFTVRLPVAE